MNLPRQWLTMAGALAAAGIALPGVTPPAHAQAAGPVQDEGALATETFAPAEEDFLLLQLQIKKYRMLNDLRGYRTQDGVCVDLADLIMALDLAVRLDKKSRRATGWLFAEDRTLEIDRDSNTVQTMNATRKLQPGEIFDMPEGWCVDTRSLAGWIGVELKPDLFQSVIVLKSEDKLPFMEALERKSRAARLGPERDRHDLSSYPSARQPYAMWSLPSVDVVARTTYRRSGGAKRIDRRYEIFASGEAARVSYDMRLASDNRGMPETLRLRGLRKDPQGRMLGPLQATEVAAGDVQVLAGNLAGAGGVGRGLFLTNRALQRPTRFGNTVLRGTLPLGWDAELYRNGQLLAFQSGGADGRYEFDVALVYGRNDLEVVLYGPQGQERREAQSVPVGFGALPAGKLEYWTGVIQRNRDLLSFGESPLAGSVLDTGWQYGAGAQYGLDRRTVVGASGHSLFLDGRRREYGEVSLQRTLGPMALNLVAAQEMGSGRAYHADLLGRVGSFNVQAETFWVEGGYTSGMVSPNERSAQRVQAETSLRLGRVAVPVSGGYSHTVQRDGRKVNEMLARASLVMPRLALTGFVLQRSSSGGGSREDGTEIGLLGNTRIGGVSVRGEGTYRLAGPRKGFDTARLTLERALDDQSELRFQVEHSALAGQTDFDLGYVRQFRQFALAGSGRIGTNGTLGANLSVSFSFGRDPLGGGMRFSREKLAERGHAAIAVFIDENGDGRRSPGEKAIADVGITAGQRGADRPTDGEGHTFVEGLTPYQPVLISIDELTLADPFLMPRGKGLVVTPRPGVPTVVELAVAPTGEIEGMVIAPEGTGLAGVELELVDAAGDVVAGAMSEFDGFFLFGRVTYGRFDLRLSERSARALGMERHLRSGIELGAQRTLVRVGDVRVSLPTHVAARVPGQAPEGELPGGGYGGSL